MFLRMPKLFETGDKTSPKRSREAQIFPPSLSQVGIDIVSLQFHSAASNTRHICLLFWKPVDSSTKNNYYNTCVKLVVGFKN